MTLRQHSRHTGTGFTLLEILVVVAIIGIIAAIAIPLYGNYITRARATDIVTKFDAAKSTANANIAGENVISQCDEVLKRFVAPTIPDEYARIAYAFEAVSSGNESGYRPVLTVCSRVANQGAQAVKVARAAHDEFAKNMSIEGGAVLTDTVVSFALPLTDPKRVVCRVPVGGPFTACGDPVAVPTLPAMNTPTPQPQAVPTPLPQSTPQIACSGGQQPSADGKTCVCPTRQQFDGAQCFTPATCTGGQVQSVDQKSCACPSGQRFDGTSCFTPAVCSGGQVPSADQKSCACPPGQTLQNGQCRNPAAVVQPPVAQQPTVQQQLDTCLAGCNSIPNPGHRQQCERDCRRQHHP